MCRRSNMYACTKVPYRVYIYIYIRPVSSDFLRGARASKPANRVPPWRKIGEWWWNGSSFCPVSTFAWIIGRFSSRSLRDRGCRGWRLFIGKAVENRLIYRLITHCRDSLFCFIDRTDFFFDPWNFGN